MNKKVPAHTAWLQHHAHRFQTRDKLPPPETRTLLFDMVRTRKRVAFVTPQGTVVCGVTVMRGSAPDTWVCNMGGPHGRPGLCSRENIVWVSGVRWPPGIRK